MRTAPPSRRECLVRRPTQADDGRGRMDGCTTRELLRCLSGQEKRCDGNEGSVVAAMGMFGFFLIHNLSVVRRGRQTAWQALDATNQFIIAAAAAEGE